MPFWQIYVICAGVAFVLFAIIGVVAVRNANSICKVYLYCLSIPKLALAAIFFPLVIVVGIIYFIAELVHPNKE